MIYIFMHKTPEKSLVCVIFPVFLHTAASAAAEYNISFSYVVIAAYLLFC